MTRLQLNKDLHLLNRCEYYLLQRVSLLSLDISCSEHPLLQRLCSTEIRLRLSLYLYSFKHRVDIRLSYETDYTGHSS